MFDIKCIFKHKFSTNIFQSEDIFLFQEMLHREKDAKLSSNHYLSNSVCKFS